MCERVGFVCASNYSCVGGLSKKAGCVVPFVPQRLLWFRRLNGTQMWFIVRGMMQLEKIGLYKANTSGEGERVREQCVPVGWR